MVGLQRRKNGGVTSPKLTPALQTEIVELLKAGNYVETACAVAGIGKTTFYAWMKKANQSTRSNRYTVFKNAVKKNLFSASKIEDIQINHFFSQNIC